jgi:hypothetical protein
MRVKKLRFFRLPFQKSTGITPGLPCVRKERFRELLSSNVKFDKNNIHF